MKREKYGFVRKITKDVVCVLEKELNRDANSSSCAVLYQPKAPKELERFKQN